MTTHKIIKVICDICQTEIARTDMRVFAGTYGLDFHSDCLFKVNGTILGLLTDEINFGSSEKFEDRPNHAPRLYWDKVVTS